MDFFRDIYPLVAVGIIVVMVLIAIFKKKK